jgi:hypothetical protein
MRIPPRAQEYVEKRRHAPQSYTFKAILVLMKARHSTGMKERKAYSRHGIGSRSAARGNASDVVCGDFRSRVSPNVNDFTAAPYRRC